MTQEVSKPAFTNHPVEELFMSEENPKIEDRVKDLEERVAMLEKQIKQKADVAYVNRETHRPKAVGGPYR